MAFYYDKTCSLDVNQVWVWTGLLFLSATMVVQESWECFTTVVRPFDTQTCQQHNSVILRLDFGSNLYELSWFSVAVFSTHRRFCVFLRMSRLFSEWRMRLFILSVFWQSFPVTDTLVSLFVSVCTRVSTAPPVWISWRTVRNGSYFTANGKKWTIFLHEEENFTTINIFMHLDRVFMKIKLIWLQHLWIFVNVSS